MENKLIETFVVVSLTCFAFGLLAGLFIDNKAKSTLQKQAIELNFAEYNNKTGKWQWRTNSVIISTNGAQKTN